MPRTKSIGPNLLYLDHPIQPELRPHRGSSISCILPHGDTSWLNNENAFSCMLPCLELPRSLCIGIVQAVAPQQADFWRQRLCGGDLDLVNSSTRTIPCRFFSFALQFGRHNCLRPHDQCSRFV